MLAARSSCCCHLAHAGGIYGRILEAADRAGVFKGQTLHSFRRGGMQHRKYLLGEPTEDIQRQAHIKTPSVADRYLSRNRHSLRLAKQATKYRNGRPVAARMLALLQEEGLLPVEGSAGTEEPTSRDC